MPFAFKNIVGWITSKIQHNNSSNNEIQQTSCENIINHDDSSLCSWYPEDEASLFALKYANYPSSFINSKVYNESMGEIIFNNLNNATSKIPCTVFHNDITKIPIQSFESFPTIDSILSPFAAAQNQNEFALEIS
jgi:hypothetical protein